MIPRDKRLLWFMALVILELSAACLVIILPGSKALLNSAWMSNKFFLFQYALFYQIGLALLNVHDSGCAYVRYGSRRAIVCCKLTRYCLLALGMGALLLLVTAAALILTRAVISRETMLFAVYGSFSFFLGTVILAEITYLASTCRLQLLRSYPELFAFLLAAAEILVFVPQFNQFGSINICICFTWIFSGRVLLSCIILLLIILALFARIITGGKKKDLCL